MKKTTISAILITAAVMSVGAQQRTKEDFLKQQAYAVMQRVTGQIDCLEQNQNDLAERVGKMESMKQEISNLRNEVSALQAQVAELKAALSRQRGEIVSDLASRIKAEEAKRPAPAPTPTPASSYTGPTKLYTVAPGDNLSIIAEAFGTNVKTVMELNGLKNHNIRVGQKLRVPGK